PCWWTPGMLGISFARSIFSLTKSGRTKSCRLRFVSRMRLRIAAVRRKRRGRRKGTGGDDERAQREATRGISRSQASEKAGHRFFAHRCQQFIHQTGVCLTLSNWSRLEDLYAHLNGGPDHKNSARTRFRHPGCLIGRAQKEPRDQTCRRQSQGNLADVAESIEYPHRLPRSGNDRRRSIGQCGGGGEALWNARDRDRFWYRGHIRHRRAGERLYWWRYCSGPGSDDEFSLPSDRIVAADFSAGTAKCDRQIDEPGNAGRRDLWLSRTCSRNFATHHSGEIVEEQGAGSGDRRLCKIDRAQAAGGGQGARKSHPGRVAVGRLHEFGSCRSDKCLSATVLAGKRVGTPGDAVQNALRISERVA